MTIRVPIPCGKLFLKLSRVSEAACQMSEGQLLKKTHLPGHAKSNALHNLHSTLDPDLIAHILIVASAGYY